MIQKIEKCLYCGEKMESKTAKKKFCSTLHRVYWNREQKYSESGSVARNIVEVTDLPKEFDMEKSVEVKHDEPPQYEVPELPNTERIAKIEQMLKAPPKYLPHSKRVVLEKELSELKFKIK